MLGNKKSKRIETLVVRKRVLNPKIRKALLITPLVSIGLILLLIAAAFAIVYPDSPEFIRQTRTQALITEAYASYAVPVISVDTANGLITAQIANPYQNLRTIFFYDSPQIVFDNLKPLEPLPLSIKEQRTLFGKLPYYGEFSLTTHQLIVETGDIARTKYLCVWTASKAFCQPTHLFWD